METTRLPWILQDRAGHRWAELDFDDVIVAGGPEDGLRYRQIEIERSGEGANARRPFSHFSTLFGLPIRKMSCGDWVTCSVPFEIRMSWKLSSPAQALTGFNQDRKVWPFCGPGSPASG
jgi:hypothetical protein